MNGRKLLNCTLAVEYKCWKTLIMKIYYLICLHHIYVCVLNMYWVYLYYMNDLYLMVPNNL